MCVAAASTSHILSILIQNRTKTKTYSVISVHTSHKTHIEMCDGTRSRTQNEMSSFRFDSKTDFVYLIRVLMCVFIWFRHFNSNVSVGQCVNDWTIERTMKCSSFRRFYFGCVSYFNFLETFFKVKVLSISIYLWCRCSRVLRCRIWRNERKKKKCPTFRPRRQVAKVGWNGRKVQKDERDKTIRWRQRINKMCERNIGS